MKLRQLVPVAVAILAVPLFAGSAEMPSLDRLFPQEAEIEADQPGLLRLPLPPRVLAATRPDLSDLRVFDAAGREVPYLLDGRRRGGDAVEARETFTSQVISVRREVEEHELGPPIHRELYEIAAPPEAPEGGTWELVFDVSARRFARTLNVRTASGADTDETLADGQAIFRLDGETRRLRVPLPAFRADSLAVEIAGEEGFFLEPHFRFESRRVFDPLGESVVALEELSREQLEGRTILELARPSGIVPDRLRVTTATGSFQRSVSVFDERPGHADRRIGKGRIFRVNALRGVHELELKVKSSSGTTLRLEIENGDAPGLDDLRVSAVMHQPVLIFELPASGGTARGTLRFGGGRAHRPRYQLQALLLGARQTLRGQQAEAAARLYDPEALGLARLGPIRRNPRFDASPALAFAMHPGAEINQRLYTHRRPIRIDPSTEGLSRLVLEPEDVARARADLADVRIVGSDSRQWPYLLQAGAVTRTLPLEIGSIESKRRVSTVRLDVPVAPVHARSLTLRAEAPFFDREYRLFGIDEDGKRQPLSQGRLVKDGRRPRPSRIGFGAQAAHGFVLEIEDGDDAPLALQSAEIRVALPQVFLVAPQGAYWLLVGNPEAKAPRYELQRVRSVVLAVSSSAASGQALEANPGFSLAARLRSEDGPSGLLQTALVWGVLLVAVAVLGLLTLRVVRAEPPPQSPPS